MQVKKLLEFAIGPVFGSLIGLITLPLISWYFAVDDVGRIAMLNAVIGLAPLILTAGLDQSYVREYSESDNKLALFNLCILPSIAITLICMWLIVSHVSLSQLLFGVDNYLYSVLVLLAIFFCVVKRYQVLELRMQQKGLAFSMTILLTKVTVPLILFMYFIFELSNSFKLLLIAYFLSHAVVFVWLLPRTLTTLLTFSANAFEPSKLKKMISFGFPVAIGAGAFWGMSTVDKLFLRSYSGFKELAVFSMAVSFASAATVLQSVFSSVWSPLVYQWRKEEGDDSCLIKVESVNRCIFFIAMLLFCFTGAFSWVVNYFIPEVYSDVPRLLLLCLLSPIIFTLSLISSVGLGIKRAAKLTLLSSIVALGINIIANYYLVPLYAAKGAACATVISFLVFYFLKSELSKFVWLPINLYKNYCMLLIITSLAAIFLFVSEEYIRLMNVLWLVCGIALCLFNKKQIIVIFKYIRNA